MTPRCPQCGFTVFTRRYPDCERCGVPLPAGMVLTRDELEALWARERAEERAVRERRRGTGENDLWGVPSGGDAGGFLADSGGDCGSVD